jgi:hypothetical protein
VRGRTIALVALATLAACAESASSRDTPAAASVTPTPLHPAPSTATTVTAIDVRVDSIEAFAAAHPAALRLFAKVPDSAAVVAVKDSTSWPEEVEETYNVVRDSAGHVLLHRTMPTSESGDWFLVATHYFAPDGRTIRYDYEMSGFSEECGILRERRRFYYDASFTLIRQDSAYTDKDDKPIDATNCQRRADDPTSASRRSADLPGTP